MNKIEALKATLVKLNDPSVYYDWTEQWNCNAGLLVQCVNNVSSNDLRITLAGLRNSFNSGFWGKDFEGNHPMCSVSGLPISEVYDNLRDIGFNIKEIDGLEQLSDEVICKRASLYGDTSDRDKKGNVIAYITAWIEILKEEEPKEERIVYVTIDKSVKKLTKQLTLN